MSNFLHRLAYVLRLLIVWPAIIGQRAPSRLQPFIAGPSMILMVMFWWPDRGRKDPLDVLTSISAVAGLCCISYPLAIAILPLLLVRQMAFVPSKLVQNWRITRR